MARGRPREFDIDEALDKAILLFWRQGYEGTSLAELIDAMGITKPSLYAAFGNKEELFTKAVDRYAGRRLAVFDAVLNQSSSRRAIESFLMLFTGAEAPDGTPCGCLMVQGALVCSPDGDSVKDDLLSRRTSDLQQLCERLERWKAEGDLPADTDTDSLGRYVITSLTVSSCTPMAAPGPSSSRRSSGSSWNPGRASRMKRPAPPRAATPPEASRCGSPRCGLRGFAVATFETQPHDRSSPSTAPI